MASRHASLSRHPCARSIALVAATEWLVVALGTAAAAEDRRWVRRMAGGPSPRAEFGLAYDSQRGRTVLFGGSSDLSFARVDRQTWEFDGATWDLVNDQPPSPVPRCDQAMAYDAVRNEVVIFGGYNGSFLGDTCVWDGVTWTPRMVTGPMARADAFMAFDSIRGVMVLFGGLPRAGAIRDDTALWDGTAWTAPIPATIPPRRWIQRMAFDSARGVTVMFGGAGSSGLLGDTWEWDGVNWEARTPPESPSPRYGFAMAYDPDRQVTVLFGGQLGVEFGVGVLGDTWEWDGASWRQLAIEGPPARSFVKMVYDQARHRMLLFGGFDGSQMVNDTWELVAEPETPVALTDLVAAAEADGIRLRWRAQAEDLVGFEVWRAADAAPSEVDYRLRGDEAVGVGVGRWEFLDVEVDAGRPYSYRIVSRLMDGGREVHGPVVATALARVTALLLQAPNPSPGATRIGFDFARYGQARLGIYDLAGRRVRSLLSGAIPPGRHSFTWDGHDDGGRAAASGIYFAHLEWSAGQAVRRLVLLR